MFNYLKITENKIKSFLLFLFIYFISSILFVFLIVVIAKFGDISMIPFAVVAKFGGIGIIPYFLDALKLFIISYTVIVFLKKEFFLKKYFKELVILFFALLITNKLFALLYGLFLKIGLFKVDSSFIAHAPFFALQLFVYYMIICFIIKED